MLKNKTVISEYVGYGHPDKIADQIADRVLFEYMQKDSNTRGGIEVMVKDNIVVLGGEVYSNTTDVNVEHAVRYVFYDLGFPANHNLQPENIKIINLIGKQSLEIHNGVDKSETEIGAGDQGFMVGYANNETHTYMPIGHYLAKAICTSVCLVPGLGPDVKSQVVVDYDENGRYTITDVTVSALRDCDIIPSFEDFKVKVMLATKCMLKEYDVLDKNIHINPNGDWTIGGPVADCGVTGRKIVVDQFGGYSSVGGGHINGGKDLTKVDRSGAYMCRFLAKNIVASGIANEAKVELGYKIGVAEPCALNVEIDTDVNVELIKAVIRRTVDLTPYGMIERFKTAYDSLYLYAKCGSYGYNDDDVIMKKCYPWEVIDKTLVKALKGI